MGESENKPTDDDETVDPEPGEESRPREDKAWPPPGLQNKTHPRPSGEK